MICQKCGKKEAAVRIKQSVNGKYNEMALCHECAENEKMTHLFGFGADDLFSGFFSDKVFGGYTAQTKRCPCCQMTYRELAKNGRPGCSECYEVFAPEIERIVCGIHGNARHAGKAPAEKEAAIKKKNEIAAMKKEQEEAIREQNYEKAAELRDKIKALEEKEG